MLVLQIRPKGIVLFVPKFGIEGPVDRIDDAATSADAANVAGPSASSGEARKDAEAAFVCDVRRQVATARDGRVFRVFDKAAVRISVETVSNNRRRLVLELVDRSLLPESEKVGT
jgi:exosome complex exonuclease DIS3/RRP44